MGFCAGVADFPGWNPSLVRVFFVLMNIFSLGTVGIIVYLVLWIIMPPEQL
ncbi:MAG: PspC domain-containing protein [Verrucomicrobiota bacterium]